MRLVIGKPAFPQKLFQIKEGIIIFEILLICLDIRYIAQTKKKKCHLNQKPNSMPNAFAQRNPYGNRNKECWVVLQGHEG